MGEEREVFRRTQALVVHLDEQNEHQNGVTRPEPLARVFVEQNGNMNGNNHAPQEYRQPHPITDSMRELQHIQRSFHEVSLGGEQTPHMIYGMLQSESQELAEAIKKDDKVEIASEIADVVILAANLANTYGINLDIAVSDKLARNGEKYNPHEVQTLREEGTPTSEVMKTLKNRWDKDKDKDYSRIYGIRQELAELIATEEVGTNGNGHHKAD